MKQKFKGELKELAQEYMQNVLRMEARIKQLESQAHQTDSAEIRRKLFHRINNLHAMVDENRRIAFLFGALLR